MIRSMIHLLLAALFLLPASQAAEPAPASTLTGASLPAGAFRLLDKDQIEKSSGILKVFSKNAEVRKVEVLLWAGDYGGDKGGTLRAEMGKALEKAGYVWKDAKSKEKFEGNDVFLSSAIKAGQRCLAVWLASAEGALLVWGELPAAPVLAEAVFENVLHTTPQGWKVQAANAGGVTFVPVDPLPEEKLFLLILPGRDFSGSLAKDAESLWTETCKEFEVTGNPWPSEKVAVRRSFKGWDYARYATTVKKDENHLFLSVTFIHVGGRLERVAALSNLVSPPYRESPTTNPRYSGTIHDYPFTLRFKNHREPELRAPKLTGDGIVGVWIGISMGVSGRTGRAEWNGYYAAFYDNGQVFFANRLPTNAFERMNPYHQSEESPRWWGTWTYENGRGAMKMLYGEIPIEAKGPDLALTTMKTPHTYVRIPPVDGCRFDGTWTMAANPGAKIPTITFGADGTFSDDGALGVLEHNLYRLYGICAKPGAGTYEAKNYSVVFRYSDGREFCAAFLGIDHKKEETKPAGLSLGFNQDPLKRR